MSDLESAPFVREETAGHKSRYKVLELPDGFRIEGQDRAPAEVHLSPTRTTLEIVGGDLIEHRGSVGLYAYPNLLTQVCWCLMQNWERPPQARAWVGAEQWARTQTAKAISYRVYGQWQRLLSQVPEPKRLVAKAVFAATFSPHSGCETMEDLYQHPHLVADIIRYRAAAHACRYAVDLAINAGDVLVDLPSQGLGHPADFGVRLTALSQRISGYGLRYARHEFWSQPSLWPLLIDLLARDWKALYSSSGSPSRSLNRTLMNLPGGVVRDLVYLPYVAFALSRPILDRVEMLTLLHLAKHVARKEAPPPWLLSLVVQARRPEILTSLRRLETHWHRTVTPTRQGLGELVSYLCDYVRAEGVLHRGTIVGLTEKAIYWHRDQQQELLQERLARFDVEARTALPPIPLPNNSAIRFLGTVQEAVLEGHEMGHCIATYADQAVAGACYLFHVEYQETSASVMVDGFGQVLQSYGPHNALTPAAAYGKQVLARWGRGLRMPVVSSAQD